MAFYIMMLPVTLAIRIRFYDDPVGAIILSMIVSLILIYLLANLIIYKREEFLRSNLKKLLITGSIFLILGIIISLLFYSIDKQKLERLDILDEICSDRIERDPPELEQGAEEGDKKSDWQVYRNSEYGFEISFPEDWFFRGGCALWRDVPSMINIITLNSFEWEKMRDEPIGGAYSEDIRITFEEITKYGVTTIDELIEKEEENDPNLPFFTPFVPEEKINIAGREAYEIVVCGYGCEYTIFIEKDGYLYKIAFTKAWDNYNDLSEVEKQILSTFKFID